MCLLMWFVIYCVVKLYSVATFTFFIRLQYVMVTYCKYITYSIFVNCFQNWHVNCLEYS